MEHRSRSCALSVSIVVGLTSVAAAQDKGTVESAATESATGTVGVGVALGQPMRAIVKVVLPGALLGVDAGVGTGTRGGKGLQITAGLGWERDLDMLHVSLGAGLRYYRHAYAPASLDETGHDRHIGLRFAAAASRRLPSLPIDVFVEAAPGVDVSRTASCSFLSGVDTVCPHDRDTPLFLDLAIGARYWFDL